MQLVSRLLIIGVFAEIVGTDKQYIRRSRSEKFGEDLQPSIQLKYKRTKERAS